MPNYDMPFPPKDAPTFEDFQRARGLAFATTATYAGIIRRLCVAGDSPGWGEHETPEAHERRFAVRQQLSVSSVRTYDAAWNAHGAYVRAVFGAEVTPLNQPPDAMQYDSEAERALATLVTALGPRVVVALTWQHVDIENGCVRHRGRIYGKARHRSVISKALVTLRELQQPKDGRQFVAAKDSAGAVAYNQRELRDLVLAAQERKREEEPAPIGTTLITPKEGGGPPRREVIAADSDAELPPPPVWDEEPNTPEKAADSPPVRLDMGESTLPTMKAQKPAQGPADLTKTISLEDARKRFHKLSDKRLRELGFRPATERGEGA